MSDVPVYIEVLSVDGVYVFVRAESIDAVQMNDWVKPDPEDPENEMMQSYGATLLLRSGNRIECQDEVDEIREQLGWWEDDD